MDELRLGHNFFEGSTMAELMITTFEQANNVTICWYVTNGHIIFSMLDRSNGDEPEDVLIIRRTFDDLMILDFIKFESILKEMLSELNEKRKENK